MVEKKQTNKIWQFIDTQLLFIVSIFLLAFIPLYPKLPLFDIIEGYIVRARIEDVLIAGATLIFFIQLLRKKITLNMPMTKIIIAYAIIGFFSTLSAIFITQTVPLSSIHIIKSFLHYFRYLEYFALFYFLSTAIKTKKQFLISVTVLIVTLLGVGIYGIGQKYLYWPVYSTMNREFSKGIVLYLTEHARVQSTFGGHYDMAAYLVIILPIIYLFALQIKHKAVKIAVWIAWLIGVWLLVLSASRTSFIAFIAALVVGILLVSLLQKGRVEKITFFFSKLITTGVLISIIFLSFGEDITERLLQSAKAYPVVTQTIDTVTKQKETALASFHESEIGKNIQTITDTQIKKPENGISVEEAEILVSSDTRPSPIKPSDVFVDVPNKVSVSTTSAEGVTTTVVIEVPRTYSDNAIKHGLSLAIRLDTLWPQALQGFYTNPLLGSGYATLTKSTVEQFTEAESTDNNFLRTLGETGLLGFITFYGAVLIPMYVAFSILRDKGEKQLAKKYFAAGFIAASVGLLINATFIDVFAASKVAFMFWAVAGILVALQNITEEKKYVFTPNKKQVKRKINKGIFKNAS